jgi:hypothetical protein
MTVLHDGLAGTAANQVLDAEGTRNHGNGVRHPAGQAGAHANPGPQAAMSPASAQQANADLIAYMMAALDEGRAQSAALYGRLNWTYWLLVIMAVIIFGVGVALLSSPLWLPATVHTGGFDWFALVFPPTLGIANLLGLYLYKPVRRINMLMGTMTQLIVVLNQYQIRVALRIVECDIADRPTIGAAAEDLRTIAAYSLGAIEHYFGRATNERSSAVPAENAPARY